MLTQDGDFQIISLEVELSVLPAMRQPGPEDVELDRAGLEVGEEFAGQLGPRHPRLEPMPEEIQEPGAAVVSDRAAVIWVDEVEVPELRALIDVGDPGRGKFQDG